jgi:Tfp pilus assembly protein PilN
MNPINFVKTPSPTRQREIDTWFKATSLIMLLGLGCAGYVLAPQIKHLKNLYHQKKIVDRQLTMANAAPLAQCESLKNTIAMFKKRQQKINQLAESPRLITGPLLAIVGTMNKETCLQAVKSDGKTITIDLNCASADAALAALEKLAQSTALREIKLVSLHASGSLLPLSATIQGVCV